MNLHHNNIVPECYADTVLVERLGFKRPNHGLNSNISNALKTIRASRPNQQVVGIIDSDRGDGEKLLEDFELVEEQHEIKKYIRGNHTVLVLCPDFEGWVFENAAKKNIDPADHGFRTPKYFKKKCLHIRNAAPIT